MVIKESEIRARGKAVTYVTMYHGTGFGYYCYEDRQVYRNGGNGFYYSVENLLRVIHDGGRQYRETVNRLDLSPLYKD